MKALFRQDKVSTQRCKARNAAWLMRGGRP